MKKIERFGMAVFGCIFNKDFTKVLLIKRNKEKREKYGFDWAIVGGKIELGEYSEDALIREIKEEIGISISKDQIRLLFVKEDPTWFNVAHLAFFQYGIILDEKTPIILNDEAEEYSWFKLEDFPKNRSDDDIESMKTLAKQKFHHK